MFFGIALTPIGWLIALMIALFAVAIPFVLIETVTSFLPEFIRIPLNVLLSFVAFPLLLCEMNDRKMFGQGRGSAFFKIYTVFFIAFGLFFIVNAVFNQSGSASLMNIVGGIIMLGVGVYMYRRARKTNAEFDAALAAQAELDREQAINDQAEAILRAEQMKSQRE